jgi:hypothetical protein
VKKLSEEEIDELVIAEADDDAAWEAPVKVEPDTRLLNDSRFLKRIETARQSFRAGRGVPLEEVPE